MFVDKDQQEKEKEELKKQRKDRLAVILDMDGLGVAKKKVKKVKEPVITTTGVTTATTPLSV